QEEIANTRKRFDLRKIILFQDVAPVLLDFLALGCELLRGQEDRHKLIATLANLTANVVEGDFVAEMPKGVLPRVSMGVDGVYQRPVDVENRSPYHLHQPLL